MSRAPDTGPAARPEPPRDRGFTLIEVVVAIGLVLTVMVAVLPQLVGGLRAGDEARLRAQAKGLAASELERMRNLPFHVEPNAGQYVDLFDRYYPDLQAPAAAPVCRAGGRNVPPTPANAGYVGPTGTRCAWEPDGAFYRVVRTVAGDPGRGIRPDPDLAGFVVVVSTRFLDAATPPQPVTPPPGYSTPTVGRDTPVTAQVGVSVTVLVDRATERTPVSTTTQISRSYQTTTRLRAAVDATALEASISLPGPTPAEGNAVSVSGGLLHLDAGLVGSSRVDLTAAGTSASAASGENSGTTRTALTAPPDTAPAWSSSGEGELSAAGCDVVCWGGGQVYGTWTPTTADGLPGVGSPTSPVEVTLRTPITGGGYALRLGAGPGAAFRPGLGLANPVLRLRAADFSPGISSSCTVSDAGSGLRLASGGWARTTAAPTGGADACATARTAEVAVLPRADDTQPMVKVRLPSASARCTVTGAGHVAATTVDFRVEVSYWNGTGYTLLGPFTEDGAATLPDPATLMVGARPLSTWIESWSVARAGSGISRVEAPGTARVQVPAVVSILTVPLRSQVDATGAVVVDGAGNPVTDEQSQLSVTVGSLSCGAEDHR